MARNTAQNHNGNSESSAVVETAEEGPATVSTLSGEQALQSLKPGLGKKRPSRGAPPQEKEYLLEGKLCQSGRFASARADEG